LGLLKCWGFVPRGRGLPPFYLLLVGVFLWGVLMEILQRLMSNGRSMELLDMLANLAGAVAGLLAYRFLEKRLREDSVEVGG